MKNTEQNGDDRNLQKNYLQNFRQGRKSKTKSDEKSFLLNGWVSVIIAVVLAIIVVIVSTIVVIEDSKRDMVILQSEHPTAQKVESGSVLLNGQTVSFEVIREEGKTYLPIEELAKALNYSCSSQNGIITITTSKETYGLQTGSNIVSITYHITATAASTSITTPPFVSDDGNTYVYVRDLASFMKDTTVSYDSESGVVLVNIAADVQ